MYLKAYIQNLVKNGPVVSEKSKFQFSYVNGIGPRSRNDLGIRYSHTFVNSISCLHLPTFRSQAATVSEQVSQRAKIAHLRTSKYFQIVLKYVKDFFNWSRAANSDVNKGRNSVANLQKT